MTDRRRTPRELGLATRSMLAASLAAVSLGCLSAAAPPGPASSGQARALPGGGKAIASPARVGPVGLPDVEGGFASTHVLVRLKPGAEATTAADGALRLGFRTGRETAETSAAGAILRSAKASRALPVFPAAARADVARRLGLDRTYRIEVPIGSDTPGLVRRLAALGSLFEYVELDGVGGLAGVPNDPEFGLQYGMHNVGQTIGGNVGLVDSDLDGPEAWDLAVDTSNVTIGLLDAGVNLHVELAGRILPGFNIPDNTTITSDECSSHGTHVSGIMAASRDNGIGVAGLAPLAKIKPWVVVNGCSGFESFVATGLQQATDAGVRLVNMSLQYYTGTQTLHDAVLYAAAADVIMIAASGNNGNGNVAYPGNWSETICVAALMPDGNPWVSSNHGAQVDLAAAGFTVRSLIGTASYGDKSGTSMATPHVTGTVALMLGKNPALTTAEVRSILQSTAVDIAAPGVDVNTGYGRVNAYAALLATPSTNPEDLDGDDSVGPGDLAILLGQWGMCADCESGCAADLDGDCTVGASDLAILLGAWG